MTRPVTALLPDLEWPLMRPFWQACTAGELAFPRCRACGQHQWYPRVLCRRCRGGDHEWAPVAPEGRVYSWSIVHRPFLEGADKSLPFAVLQVQLAQAPGVTFVTNLLDEGQADGLDIDAPVRIEFEAVAADLRLPYAVLA